MKSLKKVLAVAIAASLTLSSAVVAFAATSPTVAQKPVEHKTAVEATDVAASVTTSKKGEATITKYTGTEKKATIDTVTVNGVEYKVTAIKANAFKDTKVKTVALGESVKTIGKNAFKGAKNLKTVELKGYAKVDKKAFAGLKTNKITVKVSKSISAKDYKKLVKALKKAGISEKKIKKVK